MSDIVLADSEQIRRVVHRLKPLLWRYFRPEIRHLERIPKGSTLLIGNHDGGTIAVDALCFGAAYHEYFSYRRPLSVFMHDYPFRLSGRLTRFLNRLGIVRATRDALGPVVNRGEVALIYPGGDREAFRPYRNRRTIDLGHRTGFIAQAIRHQIPITPLASVGAHNTLFVLSDGRWLARLLHLKKLVRAEVFPILAGIPWGIWAMPLVPHFPLPAKITVEVLPPIDLGREWGMKLGPAQASDPELLQAGYRLVRGAIQSALDRLYAEREGKPAESPQSLNSTPP